ncbi:hypothetical protein K461DRAFT_292236 [Myriangium duriaei CBS 260.36]|uniref:Methyltransferase small domain-containing protein n=1 Tax=Myriangium duriaei CBS 260.36 TaxID=1168546 RepID=A0A9P4MMM9_9PEZI|nr:hypothetical protein K461DRAFT_292236 [Myriangium duriaei CBS 260.36]
MLPTPSTSHVDYDRIYEPAEDSYLLLDTLSLPSEVAFLTTTFSSGPSPLIVEVGTGSGVVLAFLAGNASAILGRTDVLALGTDLNHFACVATKTTVTTALKDSKNAGTVCLAAANADLTSPVRGGSVDMLVFNPPYVPAPLPDVDTRFGADAELSKQQRWDRDSHLLALSYAGGEEGMVVTDRLLAELPRVLSARGVAYVLLCAQNRPEKVREGLLAEGWRAEVVGRSGMKAGWEKLVILRIWRG